MTICLESFDYSVKPEIVGCIFNTHCILQYFIE